MALQLISLQAAINQATQMAGVQRQADVASATFASTLRRLFAEKLTERSETVQAIVRARGNRVENEEDPSRYAAGERRRRRTKPGIRAIQESMAELLTSESGRLVDTTV